MPAKGSSFWVFAFGYVIAGVGLSGFGLDYYSRIAMGYPQNMGIVIGNTALVLLGVTATVIAQCLKRLEQRVDRIEQLKPILRRPG